jgi:hypothetical protein
MDHVDRMIAAISGAVVERSAGRQDYDTPIFLTISRRLRLS